jgi:hypothetical protein
LASDKFANLAHPGASSFRAGTFTADRTCLPDGLAIGFVLRDVFGRWDFPRGRTPDVAFRLDSTAEHDDAGTGLEDATYLERCVYDSDAAALTGDGGGDGDGAVLCETKHIDGEACGLEVIVTVLEFDDVGHEAAEDVAVE